MNEHLQQYKNTIPTALQDFRSNIALPVKSVVVNDR